MRAFFDVYVKRDASSLAYLHRDPVANGAPAGLATIRELPAVTPAPSLDELHSLLNTRGAAEGIRELDAAFARDPEAPVFRESELNRVGYWLLRAKKYPESIAVFRKAIAIYPRSSTCSTRWPRHSRPPATKHRPSRRRERRSTCWRRRS